MQLDVYSKEGDIKGQVDMPEDIFGIEPNEHVMYQAVVAHLENKRQGNAKTKTRSEVRGGGRKPWRQKGRGTARAGSTRSPIWIGGGTIHGPKVRDYNYKLSKKVKKLAKRSALSVRYNENNIKVVEDFSFDDIKTKNMVDVLSNLNINDIKTLILLPQEDDVVFVSARNIKGVKVSPVDKISTYDILNHKQILLFKGAVDIIVKSLRN
jgi:large subunit ribosomal protein L4